MAGTKYRVLIGFNYPDPSGKGEIRCEPGDLVSDLPARVQNVLTRDGVIEKATARKSTKEGGEG